MINVIIPAYNCSATLDRTLSSLVAQTDPNFEVILIDDCSTEDVKSIVDNYQSKLNIKYIRNQKNLGCGMSRQVGIENLTYTHFTFLDSDDMFMPYTVETFNAIIEDDPDTQYIHSYFYQQGIIDNNPALQLIKEGYTWCHGKLYNINYIKKYNICNSPLIKYADDSYFNSMCNELLETKIVRLPLVLWTNNVNSVTRKINPKRDAEVILDFLTALDLSSQHILKYKTEISHLSHSLDKLMERFGNWNFSNEELCILNKLKHLTQKG